MLRRLGEPGVASSLCHAMPYAKPCLMRSHAAERCPTRPADQTTRPRPPTRRRQYAHAMPPTRPSHATRPEPCQPSHAISRADQPSRLTPTDQPTNQASRPSDHPTRRRLDQAMPCHADQPQRATDRRETLSAPTIYPGRGVPWKRRSSWTAPQGTIFLCSPRSPISWACLADSCWRTSLFAAAGVSEPVAVQCFRG